jgi:hypothetical protein
MKTNKEVCNICSVKQDDLERHLKVFHTDEAEVSHTPTPWILNNNKGWHEGWKDRGSIFECHLATGTHVPEDQNQINAAFIVRAVNCHEELVLALKNLLVANGNQKDFPNIWKEGARALAKAEGDSHE